MTTNDQQYRSTKRGMALITALSLLVLLALMGTAYVRYMSLEQDDARISVQKARARTLAEGGILAAVGEIQKAIREGRAPEPAFEFEIPLYMQSGEALEPESQTVSVVLADESAKVNINHVDRPVLEALGIPRAKARDLRNKMPRPEIPSMEERYWLSSVESLRSRGFVNAREYSALKTDLMTVYTVKDQKNPRNFVNINSAPPAVLEALFNLTPEEAAKAADKRPFRSWRDAVQKIGKPAESFNVIANAEPAREMPVELALTSRCYRIVSTVNMVNAYTSRRGLEAGIEAVVLLSDDGSYEFRYWSETPVEITEIAAAAEVVESPDDAPEEEVDTESPDDAPEKEVDTESEVAEPEPSTVKTEDEAAETPAEGETEAIVPPDEEEASGADTAVEETHEPESSDA